MTDDRSEPAPDATDTAIERIIPPEQPPMDDAAGGPTVDSEDNGVDDVATDDLTVQGGD